MTIQLSAQVARRFLLGRQGLWPGRRWRGPGGTDAAMRAVEHLQLDPLVILARAHDLILHSRVLDYRPGDWMAPTYDQRRFFDWGGWLAVRPMEELPHWRVVMRREMEYAGWREHAQEHGPAIQEMRAILADRGTVSNRDFSMAERRRTVSYRGRKDSALALYYLWRKGEAMIHHRDRFERVYALTEAVAPPEMVRESTDQEADGHLLRKSVAFLGFSRFNQLNGVLSRPVGGAELKDWKAAQLESGGLVEVRVEGWRPGTYALGTDAPILAELADGKVPEAWRPLETDTVEEATFLSPLDVVSARGRAKEIFGFDYKWEVYTPAHLRRYGYYALPILWGDRLVGRFDAKLDRPANKLIILGLWLEESAAVNKDADFALALARGMARFLRFLGAERLEAPDLRPVALRRALTRVRPL